MFAPLRARLGALLGRLLGRPPAQPGRFVAGRKFAWRGELRSAPWLWPARDYLVYVPRGYAGWARRSLVVLIHGCRQTPEEIAAATRITAMADEYGWLVLLPRQSPKANAWTCWNWFDAATAEGHGEAAIVAAQVREMRRAYRVHPRRIYVAGLSAGGALAATLGVRQPHTFAGVFVHSGLPCGAASDPAGAAQAMRGGANTDTQAIGARARAGAGGRPRVPLLAVYGERDPVVAEVNAFDLVRQYLALNGCAIAAAPRGALPPPDGEADVVLPDGRTMKVADYRDGKRLAVRVVKVPGLGHAWSGGDADYPYADPKPPDATRLLAEFVEGRLRP